MLRKCCCLLFGAAESLGEVMAVVTGLVNSRDLCMCSDLRAMNIHLMSCFQGHSNMGSLPYCDVCHTTGVNLPPRIFSYYEYRYTGAGTGNSGTRDTFEYTVARYTGTE